MSVPPLARLATAQAISLAGDRVHHLAMVALLTASAAAAGRAPETLLFGLSAALFLPGFVLPPLVGPLLDRLPPARVMAVVDAARSLFVFALPLALATWKPWPSLLLLLVFYSLNAVFLPARGALPPRLVPRARLADANAGLVASAVLAALLATALGGAWIDRVGWATALRLDAATYAVSAILLWSLARPSRGAAPERAPADLGPLAAFALLWRSARARSAVSVWIVLWGLGGFLHVAGVAHLAGGGQVARLGVAASLLGLGALAGLGVARWRARRRAAGEGDATGVAGALPLSYFGLGGGLGLLALAGHPAGVAASLLLLGALAAPLAAHSESELQRAVPRWKRASAFAAREPLARLAFLLGAGAAALLATRWATTGALASGALAMAAAALVTGVLRASSRKGSLPLAPAAARTDSAA